jgi:PKD repeat protein
LEKPIFQYRNPPGTGAAGAAVIVGPNYPSGSYPDNFDGGYFFGDYAKAFVKLIKFKKGKSKTTPLVTGVAPVDFAIGPNGNLAFADFITGAVRELRFAPDNKSPVADIAASPTSGQAPLTVSFSGLGSSDPNGDALTYDWDFGDGSPHSSDPAPVYAYPANGVFTARLTVTDPTGASDQDSQVIVVGNTAPAASMVSPTDATLSRAGEQVTLQATGSDPEDGVLGPAAFSWNVVLIHKQHQHPLGDFVGNPVPFEAVRDHDADSFYEVTLTVTDSGGLATGLPTVTVNPETVPLRILSRPRGIVLDYGGRDVKAPKKVQAAIGFHANLSAPQEVTKGGVTWNFAGWSRRGHRSQIYEIPPKASKIRAVYKRGK